MAFKRASTVDIAFQKIMNGWMNEQANDVGFGVAFMNWIKHSSNCTHMSATWEPSNSTGLQAHTHVAATISRISQMLEFILLISTIYFHLFRNFTTRDDFTLKSTSHAGHFFAPFYSRLYFISLKWDFFLLFFFLFTHFTFIRPPTRSWQR